MVPFGCLVQILFDGNYAEQGNGIVIGTSSDVRIRNITYRNSLSNRTAYGMHIKFKETQTGHVSGVTYENITVIEPYRYVMGINQNDQARRRRLATAARDGRPLANVSISDISFRNIRTVGGKALMAGMFECDVQKSGHEDGAALCLLVYSCVSVALVSSDSVLCAFAQGRKDRRAPD